MINNTISKDSSGFETLVWLSPFLLVIIGMMIILLNETDFEIYTSLLGFCIFIFFVTLVGISTILDF